MGQFLKYPPDLGGRKNAARQICDALTSQIMSGVYGPGAHLPSTRALAVELGVSRTTVTAAYEQLLAEGFLDTRQGAKTRVAQTLARINRRRSGARTRGQYGCPAMVGELLAFPPRRHLRRAKWSRAS
jgi:GntR family transcriptional regulator/MocR family aminotransferase